MENFLKYIIVVFVLFSITFAVEKSKKSVLGGEDGALVNLQEFILDDDNGDVVYRKRAHKRKRKVRPRRNGF